MTHSVEPDQPSQQQAQLLHESPPLTTAEATERAVHTLNLQLQQSLDNKTPVLLLVSGGSALNLLNLLDLDPIILLANHLTIGVLDERFSKKPDINNFSQFMQTKLFAAAEDTGAIFIDTRIQAGETAEKLAARFEAALKTWKHDHPRGKILITQGMGPDGHTAGIMPFPENAPLFNSLFNQPKHWVTSYDAGPKIPIPLRITTTCTFLKLVDCAVFYVTGTGKQAAWERLQANSGDLSDSPARIIREMKHVVVCTDLQAK